MLVTCVNHNKIAILILNTQPINGFCDASLWQNAALIPVLWQRQGNILEMTRYVMPKD